MNLQPMKIVENDSWLEPVSDAVTERYQRYLNRMAHIEGVFGSLKAFSTGDQLFGFNYDKIRKGWWCREWAPGAAKLYLFGDFNATVQQRIKVD